MSAHIPDSDARPMMVCVQGSKRASLVARTWPMRCPFYVAGFPVLAGAE